MKKLIVCLAVVSAAFAARAGNVWFPNDTWSKDRNTAIITASMWSSEDGSIVCPAISADDDYVVVGKAIRFSGQVFGGNSLTMRSGVMVFDGGSGNEFPRDGLILEGGAFYNNSYSSSADPNTTYFHSIGGKVTVLSTVSSPFSFKASQYAHRGTVFTGSLIGGSTAAFKVTNQVGSDSSHRMNTCYVFLNAEGYMGEVDVLAHRGSSFSGLDMATGFYLGTTTLPGTVTVGKGAAFGAYRGTDACSVGTLSLARGSRICVAYDAAEDSNGSIAVTERFLMTGDSADGVIDVLLLQTSGIVAGRKYPILSVPGSGLDEEDFGLTTAPGVAPGEFMLRVEPNDQGGETLYAMVCSVHLVQDDNHTYKKFTAYSSAFTNAASWSDGKVPHAGADYYVDSGRWFREIDDIELDYVFPARNLTILGGESDVSLICGGHSLEVTNLVVASGANFRLLSRVGNGPVIKGESLELQEGARLVFYGYANALSQIHSEVSGAGFMETIGIGATDSAMGFLEFKGLNTNWTGRLKINYASSPDRGYPGDSNGYYTLYVSDERNLGGALEEFDFKALTLAGWSRFVPRNSLTLTPEYNRGIYVETNGSFNVEEECVLTCNRTLTVNGAVYKEGKGTLVLGGVLKFYDEENDAATDVVPENAENSLNLRDGTLKIGAAKACDGLTIRVLNLANKTPAIRVPVDVEQGSDLARYGLYNVKADASPFVLADGLETLPIAFDGQAELPMDARGMRTNALVTVHNSAVASVREILPKVAGPYSNARARWEEIPVDGENATTFAAISSRKGFYISFR